MKKRSPSRARSLPSARGASAGAPCWPVPASAWAYGCCCTSSDSERLTAIDPDDLGSLRGVGLGTGIWSLIVPLVAMFLGGVATAKVAGPITRTAGAIHGAVLWSLANLAATLLVMSVVSAVVGGAAHLGSQAAKAAGQAIDAAPAEMLLQTGVTADDMIAR